MGITMMNPAVTCPGESQVNIGETSTVLKDNRGMLMLSDYDEIMCVCVCFEMIVLMMMMMMMMMMMIFDYLIMFV